jgi:hypothetical protein
MSECHARAVGELGIAREAPTHGHKPNRSWQTERVQIIQCLLVVLGVSLATTAHADPLPGRFEADGGAHFTMLGKERCTSGVKLDFSDERCELPLFAGIDLGLRSQISDWFSLGLRAGASKELTEEDGQPYVRCSLGAQLCRPASIERDLWLFEAALEARFDPPVWPRALSASLELGTGIVVASGHYSDAMAAFVNRGHSSAWQVAHASDPPTRAKVGFLSGVAVGWDFWLSEPVMIGFDLRARMILGISSLGNPWANELDINLIAAPWVIVGTHVGYRW